MFGFFLVLVLVGIVTYFGVKNGQEYMQKQIGGELTPTVKLIVFMAVFGVIHLAFFLLKILTALILLIL